jgi:hypothetical protein
MAAAAIRHPMVIATFCCTVVAVAVSWLAPEVIVWATGEMEGPAEQVTHLVLGAATLAWAAAAWRARGAPRLLAVAVFAYVLLLMLEEIDYGSIYGIGTGLRPLIGIPSLHQSQWEATTVLFDKLLWFALPTVALYASAFAPITRFDPVRPTRTEAVACAIVFGTYIVVDAATSGLMPLYQGLTYGVMTSTAVRAFRSL